MSTLLLLLFLLQSAPDIDAVPGQAKPGAASQELLTPDAPPVAAEGAAKTELPPPVVRDEDVKKAKAEEAQKNAPESEEKAPESESAKEAAQPWYIQMMNMGLMGYMIQGGPFMWPILFLGILAIGVIIERYRSLKLLNTDTAELRRKVLSLLQDGKVDEALAMCDAQQGPVPAILSQGLRKFLVLQRLNYDPGKIEEQVVKTMDDYGVHIVAALERHLPILATVSSVAPMIGFLGTVQGMVISFQDIVAKSGEGNIVELAAAGIMVSLLTTVLGLIVGIPAFIGFNYFSSVINRFVLDVEETATELIEAVTLEMACRQHDAASEPVNS